MSPPKIPSVLSQSRQTERRLECVSTHTQTHSLRLYARRVTNSADELASTTTGLACIENAANRLYTLVPSCSQVSAGKASHTSRHATCDVVMSALNMNSIVAHMCHCQRRHQCAICFQEIAFMFLYVRFCHRFLSSSSSSFRFVRSSLLGTFAVLQYAA